MTVRIHPVLAMPEPEGCIQQRAAFIWQRKQSHCEQWTLLANKIHIFSCIADQAGRCMHICTQQSQLGGGRGIVQLEPRAYHIVNLYFFQGVSVRWEVFLCFHFKMEALQKWLTLSNLKGKLWNVCGEVFVWKLPCHRWGGGGQS